MSISPKLINTTDNAISRFDPEKRSCYAKNEFNLLRLSLENGFRYSMSNCRYESLFQKTFRECECQAPFAKDLIITGPNAEDLKNTLHCSGIFFFFKESTIRFTSSVQGRENVYGRPNWSGPSFGSESCKLNKIS